MIATCFRPIRFLKKLYPFRISSIRHKMTSDKTELFEVPRPSSYFRIQPQNLKRSEDLLSIEFTHPGIAFCMFDRNDNPTLKSLMELSSSAEEVGISPKVDESLFAHDWYADGDLHFVISNKVKISQLMYQRDLCQKELLARVTCVDVGRSLMKTFIELFMENKPEPVLESIYHFANVDARSRRSKPFPSWISEKFKEKRSQGANSHTKEFSRPQDTFVLQTSVTWSETDNNAHCTFTSYTTYAVNALHAGLRLRDLEKRSSTHRHEDGLDVARVDKEFFPNCGNPSALKGISPHMLKCGVKDFNIRYFQECHEGDVLNTHIWQDGDKDNVVFCSIEKGSKVICQLIMGYHTHKSKM